jgi:hypothetical protein
MARIHKNPIVQGISGKFGGQVVFRHLRDGRTILCSVPDFSRRVLSKGQKAHHTKFKEGAAYAKSAARTEPVYAQLAAGTMKTAYNVALADFFHPPVIHSVERVDSALRIRVSDDVRVKSVLVTVFDKGGNVLESGKATEAEREYWTYLPQHDGRLTVEARDLAGNVTRREIED